MKHSWPSSPFVAALLTVIGIVVGSALTIGIYILAERSEDRRFEASLEHGLVDIGPGGVGIHAYSGRQHTWLVTIKIGSTPVERNSEYCPPILNAKLSIYLKPGVTAAAPEIIPYGFESTRINDNEALLTADVLPGCLLHQVALLIPVSAEVARELALLKIRELEGEELPTFTIHRKLLQSYYFSAENAQKVLVMKCSDESEADVLVC